MEYRRLGNSGLKVSALSFGSWVTFVNQLDKTTATQCMDYAYNNGVNLGQTDLAGDPIQPDDDGDRYSSSIDCDIAANKKNDPIIKKILGIEDEDEDNWKYLISELNK